MGNHPSVDRGKQWLEQVLALSGLDVAVVAEIRESLCEHSCWLEIDPTNLNEAQQSALIGENGHVIDALQYLANVTLNLDVPEADKGAYTVDLSGYREARHQVLETLAEAAIAKLNAGNQEAEIPGLSAAERRQLHHWIEQNEELSTFSRGQEPERHLVVCRKAAVAPTE
ncbi:RNA-binding protein [filamentous cyanobacterium LEGE 11480]|uniref:RNA-binding protein n=2 Tax=Romeriopsis TaxID=2992131 RepID=A0A928Z3A5_9CYAN|nr:RNA-binding protein [Romeriopsis navalis LEGE 11480]